MNKKKYSLTVIISTVLMIILPFIIAFSFQGSHESNDPFLIENGVMNINETNIDNKKNGINFEGEMEFYYNKWLVTDNIKDEEPDTYISMPCYWSDISLNGGISKLPKSGYATYRFKIEGIPRNTSLSANSSYFYSSFRIFYDDTLVAYSGKPAKDKSEDVTASRISRAASYIPTKSSVTVTIEVGNSNNGGLVKAPCLYSGRLNYDDNRSSELLLFTIMGLLSGCLIILSFAVLISYGKKIGFVLTIASISSFLQWLFSAEGLMIIKLIITQTSKYMEFKTAYYLFFLLFSLSFFLCILLMEKNDFKRKKIQYIIYSAVATILTMATIFLQGSSRFLIPFTELLIVTVLFLLYIVLSGTQKKGYLFIFYVMMTMLVATTMTVLSDANILTYSFSSYLSTGLAIIDLIIMVFFFLSLFKLNKIRIDKNKLLEEQHELKTLALKEQINPNIIFNTLNVLVDFYHNDITKGDQALELFSTTLRYSINSMEKTLVTFDNESEDVLQYTEFENMRANRAINLILNIDEYEFMIPPLSLKPIVEKAYLHTFKGIDDDKNIIEIKTSLVNNNYIINIIDYRGGYELKNDDEIKNLVQRLDMSVKGKAVFFYNENKTITTFIIPKTVKRRQLV